MDDLLTVTEKLAEPFHPKRVHWRVGATNAKKLGVKPWEATSGMPLAYIDARDVMERLDAIVGSENWMDAYEETSSGRVICSLTLFYPDIERYVTKSDGAGNTGTEGEKGAISDAFKRAAVKFGIGRYLYSIKSGWIDLENGKIPKNWLEGTAPQLLPTYRPSFFKDWRNFTDALMENCDSVLKIKEWLGEDNFEDAKAEMLALSNEDKLALNRAWTKGGCYTPRESQQIKFWNNDFEKGRNDA